MIKPQILYINSDNWVNFVREHPSSNIFHCPQWAETIRKSYGLPFYVAAIMDQNNIICGAPFCISHSLFTGSRIISIPYSDFCQPLDIKDDNKNIQALAEYFQNIGNMLNIKQIELRWEYGSQTDYKHRTFFTDTLSRSRKIVELFIKISIERKDRISNLLLNTKLRLKWRIPLRL